MRRTPGLALFSVAVALAVGGTSAFVTLDKSVVVTVDGQARVVHGLLRTVGDVLDSGRVTLGPHDSVTPGLGAAVDEQTRITVRHGRPVALSLDGRTSLVWTGENVVGDVLDSIGVRTDGAYLSAPRSAGVPLVGMGLVVRRPHRVSVLADGRVLPLVTTVSTVGEAVRAARVTVGGHDRLSAPSTAYPSDGMVIGVTRVRGSSQRVSEPLPFQTVRRPDASLYRGRTVVLRPGAPGVRVSVVNVTFVNGRLVARRVVQQQVTAAPQPRIELVGTRPVPRRRPAPRWSGGGSPSGLDWGALASCESGGNPRAISASGTYRGLYQFSVETWHGVGGSGDPAAASSAEQTYRARLLYARSGPAPWPVCGRYL